MKNKNTKDNANKISCKITIKDLDRSPDNSDNDSDNNCTKPKRMRKRTGFDIFKSKANNPKLEDYMKKIKKDNPRKDDENPSKYNGRMRKFLNDLYKAMDPDDRKKYETAAAKENQRLGLTK